MMVVLGVINLIIFTFDIQVIWNTVFAELFH